MANRTDPLAKAVHGTNPQVRTGGALVQATTVTRLFVFSFHVFSNFFVWFSFSSEFDREHRATEDL